MGARYIAIAYGFETFSRRRRFRAQAREETWRLLADLVASGMMLNKALQTAADAATDAGRHARAAILRDIEAGIARAQTHQRIRRYVVGAEALVFKSLGKTEAEGIFRAAARLAAQQNKLSAALRSALAMPVMLIGLMFIIAYIMGTQLFPAMEELGDVQNWPWYARMTSNMTQWFVGHVAWVIAPIVALAVWIAWLLPNWTNGARKYADRFAPFSLYKLQQGTAFVFTVIELGRMGQTLSPVLLNGMAEDANPYLRSRMETIAGHLSTQRFGVSMQRAGQGFPAPDLVTVCVALDGTNGWIERFAKFLDRWLELLEARVKEQVAVLNAALMVALAVILAGVAGSMLPLLTLTF